MLKPEVVELNAQYREKGEKTAKALRKQERVPAVLYGPKIDENIHCSVEEIELEKILSKSRVQKVRLKFEDGTSYDTLLKQTSFHPVTDRPLHTDFYVMDEDRKVTLRVPIRLEGIPVGVTEGGRTYQPMYIVRIRAYPENIPAEFTLDISGMNISDSYHVSDLQMEGIEAFDDPGRTVVTIRPPKSEALLQSLLETGEEEEEEEELLEEGEEAEGEESEGEGSEEEGEEGEGGEESKES